MTIQVRSNDHLSADFKLPVDEPKDEKKPAPGAEEVPEQKEPSESETDETEEKEAGDESENDSELDDDSEEPKDSANDKPKKKGGFQRRIDKLNARTTAAQQEAEYWKAMALKKEAGEPKSEKVEPKSAEGKPKSEDFESHAEYVEALTDWKIEQREKAKEVLAQKSQLEADQEKALNSHYEREEAFAEKNEDYPEVVAALFKSTKNASAALQDLIVSSENSPEILYALAKDPQEFKRINALSPMAMAREIGKIEAKLTANSSEEKKQEPNKLTKAPKPIEPVGKGSKGTAVKSISDENISQADYERLRMEQIKKRRAS